MFILAVCFFHYARFQSAFATLSCSNNLKLSKHCRKKAVQTFQYLNQTELSKVVFDHSYDIYI